MSPDKKKVLMVHRIYRNHDDHFGKYNGLGGKMESTEDVATCIRREIREEAGIECGQVHLRGTINWTGFGPKGEDWLGFIFRIDTFTGNPFTENDEGRLEWIDIDKIDTLPMWEGDKCFLHLVFDGNPIPFHGYMPYDHETLLSWYFVRE
jgi:8-oxo-dGTP diphosphatase